MSSKEIKTKIKEMLATRLKLTIKPDEITDDEPLFGPGNLSFDSIDALEIVVGLQKEFGCVIDDKDKAEKILVSINTIAEFVESEASK
jgi:acyl carrier protein